MNHSTQESKHTFQIRPWIEPLGSFGLISAWIIMPMMLLLTAYVNNACISTTLNQNHILLVLLGVILLASWLIDSLILKFKSIKILLQILPWLNFYFAYMAENNFSWFYILLGWIFILISPNSVTLIKSVLILVSVFFLFEILFTGQFICNPHYERIGSTKANMHSLQTMVETYAVDHKSYAESVAVLEHEAKTNPKAYWINFQPSFGRPRFGTGQSVDDAKGLGLSKIEIDTQFSLPYEDWFGIRFYWPWLKDYRGMVIYDIQGERYWIYGLGGYTKPISDKGRILTLSNS